ncbi:MAG TPA: hypothetical protein VLL77_08085 [Anaerolineales bacterium]|nr:hypothetical protein [Anaerolineales bacterium]
MIARPSSAHRQTRPDVFERLSRLVTLGAFGVAAIAAFAAPLLALSWRQTPFPGVLVEHTLVVNSRIGEGWTGREAGLEPPVVITRLAGESVSTSAAYHRALQGYAVGDAIPIFASLPDGVTRLFPRVELISFPLADFVSLFWLPFVVGLAYFGIGVWVYVARGRDRPGRALAFFCACVAIVAALLFDVLTSHAATPAWAAAVAFLGGTLVSLAMRFPVEWAVVRRRAVVLLLPYLVSLSLTIWMVAGLYNPSDPWQFVEARSWAYRYAALACLLFFGVMVYRAPQARDSAVRRQARLVLVGSLIAFTPVVIWFLAPVFGASLAFNSLVMLPILLVFPLTVALAIMRYRLLEIDAIVNRAIVYAIMTAVLAGVFTAVISLSQRAFIAMTGEQSDAAIVITTLIVASAIAPLRTGLQAWVDRQFREVPTGTLRTFEARVADYLEMQDSETLARRLLAEAVGALGAECGAILRPGTGETGPALTLGPWRGLALMSVPIEAGGESFGLLMMGPRRGGKRYRRSEAESLARTAGQVAQAMLLARARLPRAAAAR